eukprot:Partr_v1_DN28653_c1_g1_i6_m49644 putative nuclear protein SNF4
MPVRTFLGDHTCYDVLPVSYRQLVLDVDLSVKKSLLVMLQNSLSCAPVWDGERRGVCALLRDSDFIRLIMGYCERQVPLAEAIKQIEGTRIRDLPLVDSSASLLSTSLRPEDSILQAAEALIGNGADSVLLMGDCGDLISIIDHFRILKFIAVNYTGRPLTQSLKEAAICRYGQNVPRVYVSDTVMDVLRCFVSPTAAGMSGDIPVLDSAGVIVDTCNQGDFINLIPSGVYENLTMPVSDMLLQRVEVCSFMLMYRLALMSSTT